MPAATLRAWERRYGVPVPRRTATAYRLYSADDIALIRRMKELVDAGIAPAEAARLALQTADPVAVVAAPHEDVFALARTRLLGATQRWDADAIDSELARLSILFDAPTFYTRIVAPLLFDVGRLWEEGVLSIAQEHLLSEKLELTLRATLRASERAQGPLALLACIEGEAHVLGLLGAALRLTANGFRVITLGAATPPDALGAAVRHMAPRLVGLSVTRPPADATQLFRAYGKQLRSTPWVVGGRGSEKTAPAVAKSGGSTATDTGPAWASQIGGWLRGNISP